MVRDYNKLREQFTALAQSIAHAVSDYTLDGHLGPHGEPLHTTLASLGAKDAQRLIIVTSGIHGVELPMGSALQQQWMQAAHCKLSGSTDTRFLFVHALNPYGSAYGLRNDQANIDPCRNFIPDFKKPPTSPPFFEALKEASLPTKLGVLSSARSWQKLLKFALITHSIPELTTALCSGQYTSPKHMYYGGITPSWTRQTWDKILAEHVTPTSAQQIWHIDLHTGEGQHGAFQLLISGATESPLHQRIKALGHSDPVRLTSSFSTLSGDFSDYWLYLPQLTDRSIIPISVEIGTSKAALNGIDVLHAMMQRNALAQNFNDTHPSAESIIENMQNSFCPCDKTWEETTLKKGQIFWRKILDSPQGI